MTPARAVEQARRGDRVARSLLRCFRKKQTRSEKRCPVGYYVRTWGRIDSSAHGWELYRGKFRIDAVSDGLGRSHRAQARRGAWDYYEEIFDEAHELLRAAGAWDETPQVR